MRSLTLAVAAAMAIHGVALAETSSKSTSEAIYKGYSLAMDSFFLGLVNLSTKHKDAKGFFTALLGNSASKEILEGLPADEPTPKMVLMGETLEVSSKGQTLKLSLGSKLGMLNVQGLSKKDTNAGLSDWLMKLFERVEVIPRASAGVINWFYKGIPRVMEATVGMKEVGHELIDLSTSERIAGIVSGLAHVTAQGAALGCSIGLTGWHLSDRKETFSPLEACETTAIIGAAVMTGSAGTFMTAGFLAKGVMYSTEVAKGAIKGAINGISPATKEAIKTSSRYITGAGMTAAVVHGVDGLVKSDGVKLVCTGGESFRMEDLSLSKGGSETLYSDIGDGFINFPKNNADKSVDGLKKYLKSREEFKQLDDAPLTFMAETILGEVKGLNEYCKKRGKGYSEPFRVERDKEAVKASKAPEASKAKEAK